MAVVWFCCFFALFHVASVLCVKGRESDCGNIPGITVGPVEVIVAVVGKVNDVVVDGIVSMKQHSPNQHVTINGTITGLPPGKHGFHISQNGDMTSGCYVSGVHYNPFNQSHGAPTDRIRQVGDLGNIYANEDGVAEFSFTDSVVSLFPTQAFIIGRVLVIHETFDDMGRGDAVQSKLNGNAGGRLACGIIAYK